MSGPEPELLWSPAAERVASCRMSQYQRWLATEKNVSTTDYRSLWQWSVTDPEGFWSSIWEYFDVLASVPASTALAADKMPGAQWFPGARLNWAENLLRHIDADGPAIISLDEDGHRSEIGRAQLVSQVATLAAQFRAMGVRPGDRIAAVLPNIAPTVVAVLAAASVGAVWSCCAPDFGLKGLLDRFTQIEPTVLIGVDGYRFNHKTVDRRALLAELQAHLPTVENTIMVRHLDSTAPLPVGVLDFAELITGDAEPRYEQVPFDHPLWILYSSGTTGLPKGIVHSHGGILLESLKANALHYDLGPTDRVFIAASTAWVVWNMLVDAMVTGATIVTYDGSPTADGPDTLFRICGKKRVTRFGTGAAYLTLCEKAGATPGEDFDLGSLRSIMSTGSPLPDSTWAWVYREIAPDVHLGSDSGGTDVATAFVGANPLQPVYTGELQGPCLGVAVEAWDAEGHPLIDEVGEMVITAPMPSMPIYFWNDPDGHRYHDAYFDTFPGVWRHGDWITVTDRGSCLIHGRSDSTINRGGVRMGSADIYQAVEALPEIADALVIGAELPDGGYHMPLFVVLHPGYDLDDALVDKIRTTIRTEVSPRHVPDEIVDVPAVPTTRTGKRLEVPIKKLIQGAPPETALNRSTVADTDALDWYIDYANAFHRSRQTQDQ
ncbi:acetoacetyl-CoA synthetase [Rhodococcus aetherivorans]|uniref:Acetoacetyl-CoA synthetase n=1 Tax=Rhodococcus aetherivorans TaxID=191292 RepID=A0ABQ0YF72_9NOCA|nr:acetoacetate--CoA ligase [Rhodococcus aetherivorans]ETT24532.1 acetoacetyl-CoA synthase [Rhodococcus rhodochrous ATCC 21198]KDE10232.1 acetoacetyl-CoA synthetase [Rhodococcus aetherivorans]NGP27776.1 acetoacetate--CoA ligase [Rhodococcus aetherivorans]GES35181.1 acetoacetyl-CoA synthetase [Rhodococcus aetherivorans]